jgi:hypothetical protein
MSHDFPRRNQSKQSNVSVTGPRVDTETIQAAGPRHKKQTRAAPVHAKFGPAAASFSLGASV